MPQAKIMMFAHQLVLALGTQNKKMDITVHLYCCYEVYGMQ